MDFLSGLFNIDDDNRRKHRGSWEQTGHHQDHDDHDDHTDDHDDQHDRIEHNQNNPNNIPNEYQFSPEVTSPGSVCSQCSARLIQGAKFCHKCGKATDVRKICASCRSMIPMDVAYCPQCGYKNG
jgi:ribosomal protein L40E